MPEISVVLPAHNEESNITVLHQRLLSVLRGTGASFEIIFVDDGSRDGTAGAIAGLCRNNPHLKLLRLSRNFGHQVALTAGLAHASGDAVISMDADLQHPPEVIPEMLRLWREGADVVLCLRTYGNDVGFFKRKSSEWFYRIFRYFADIPLEPNAADFRLLSRKVVDSLNRMEERSRFLRGLTAWVGFRTERLEYLADPRHSGQTKYSLRRMIRFAIDGVTSFSVKPLRISAYLGAMFTAAGGLYGLFVFYAFFFKQSAVPGWASLMLVVLFLGGFQLMSIGLMGIYLGRIYEEVKRRPLYLVMEKIGFEEAPSTRK